MQPSDLRLSNIHDVAAVRYHRIIRAIQPRSEPMAEATIEVSEHGDLTVITPVVPGLVLEQRIASTRWSTESLGLPDGYWYRVPDLDQLTIERLSRAPARRLKTSSSAAVVCAPGGGAVYLLPPGSVGVHALTAMSDAMSDAFQKEAAEAMIRVKTLWQVDRSDALVVVLHLPRDRVESSLVSRVPDKGWSSFVRDLEAHLRAQYGCSISEMILVTLAPAGVARDQQLSEWFRQGGLDAIALTPEG